MELGPYYQRNQKKLAAITDKEWQEALAKCVKHLSIKLRKKTLYGVHAASRLGAEASDHYISLAYERIISGEWEFKDGMDIAEQMIRIIGSYMSKAIEHSQTERANLSRVTYSEIDEEFYEREIDSGANEIYEKVYAIMVGDVDEAVKDDEELFFIWDAIKEGKTRSEIAALMDKTVRQFDKLREKLIRTVKKKQLVD
ncbi:hypothetical protein [Flaviaesturariibacter amylovorans]|uniref:Sigma-70 family RNA polymerase sigma factor n=1 Tax=Flaviaesturariibacter amylovorans TaxID=1084520 RepID=A0ABP8H6C0_9BACT